MRMIVLAALLLVGLPQFCLAQSTRPTTKPTSRPSLAELHAKAVKAMRMRQWAQAGPLIDRAFAARPVFEHDRALILNRGIMDLQRGNAMRAVGDLSAWAAAHPEIDELFINVLGAALDRAGKSPRVVTQPAYVAAKSLCDRMNGELEATKPSQRRYGGQWVSHGENQQRHNAEETGKRKVEAAIRERDAAAVDAASAKAEFDSVNTLDTGKVHNHRDDRHGSRLYCHDCILIREKQEKIARAKAALRKAEAVLSLKADAVERAKAAIPQPQWPVVLDPVEPIEPVAAPVAAPAAAAPATQPA